MRSVLPLLLTAAVFSAACSDDNDPIGPVAQGSITFASALSLASVPQGGATTLPVVITRAGGFTGPVTLTAENLPTGVTATFEPATATIASNARVSTMTLNASASATASATPTTIRIRASGNGVTSQAQDVALTVTAGTVAGFTATASPAAFTLTAGQTATSTLTVGRQGGFTGNVQFALQGAPTGVTATIAPNPVSGTTAAVSIVTTAATQPGTYQVTINGTATGAAARAIPMTLVIAAP